MSIFQKIKQSIKLISDLGENFDLQSYHETCSNILKIVSKQELDSFVEDMNSPLYELSNGNYSVVANYIINFIEPSNSLSYCIEIHYMLGDFLKNAQDK